MSENNGVAELDRNLPGPVDLKAIEAAWLKSSEYARVSKQKRYGRRAAAVFGIVFVVALIAFAFEASSQHDISVPVTVAVVALYCVGFSIAFTFSERPARRRYIERQEDIHRAVVVRRAEAIAVANDLDLSNLFGVNRALMNQYHGLTKDQAEKSFRYSQNASFIGLALLVAGCLLAFAPVPDLTKITVAGLAGIGTMLSGYISRTFLRSHELAIDQFNNFFRQPLVSNYLLMAERLSNGLDAKAKDEATMMIIKRTIDAARRAEDQIFDEGIKRTRRPRWSKAKSSDQAASMNGAEVSHS